MSCPYIITMGPRQGQPCGKPVASDGKCKLHSKKISGTKGYIYLSEYSKHETKEKWFKIGLSEGTKRPSDHGPPILILSCSNIEVAENNIKAIFAKKYRKEMNEYFSGDPDEMQVIIFGIVSRVNHNSHSDKHWLAIIEKQMSELNFDDSGNAVSSKNEEMTHEEIISLFITQKCKTLEKADTSGNEKNKFKVLYNSYIQFCEENNYIHHQTEFKNHLEKLGVEMKWRTKYYRIAIN